MASFAEDVSTPEHALVILNATGEQAGRLDAAGNLMLPRFLCSHRLQDGLRFTQALAELVISDTAGAGAVHLFLKQLGLKKGGGSNEHTRR
jgi:hypothetical protein